MTHDWMALQRTVTAEFSTRLAAVTDWDAPTPDTEWTVRDLVTHVIDEQRWVPHLLAGRTVQQANRDLEPLRPDNLIGEWELYSLAAEEAWRSATPSAKVHLWEDIVTPDDFLREQVADIAIHTWDLARAIGANETLDVGLVEAVWSVFEPQAATLAASGLFAQPVLLGDDAPLQARLLAITGRDPR